MNQERFTKQHEPEWDRLAKCLEALEKQRGKPSRDSSEFPVLYRRLCQHFALAQSRAYSHSLIERLHRLALRAHQQLYAARAPLWRRILEFVLRDYPRLARREWRLLVASSVLFFGPIFALIVGIQVDPDLVYTVLAPQDLSNFETMYDPDNDRRFGREQESASDFLMFGHYIRNNTTIGFQTFAGGMLFGIGTLFYLLFNGIYLGAVAGHLTGIGYGTPFWSFVAGHSAFELTAIVLSGAAGLKLGGALVAPGRRGRARALREASVCGVRMVYGAAVLFLLAAFVEAFWSSMAWVSPTVKYSVGIGLWLVTAAYLLLVGRPDAR